ncbi:hypothetical protein M2D07_015720 [Pseudomonas sp. BGr12]|uniref:hypothetical protein n=1 Tax=Pseudomonas sp. BGr12 TaxID=2936269 RepID=UPI002559AF07|nr:hypothetical protein [Pseudomonas sp. BJa5]MDL2428467.1 hypothetical protein [Pseudomonas sp. BJa5]
MTDLSDFSGHEITGSGDILDLSSHQKNLLLVRPLLRLDFNKLSHTRDDGSYLLEGIDTNYLCLAALYYMMEGTALHQGFTRREVIDHLKGLAGTMQEGLDELSRQRIAEIVLDTLSNASNKYVEHKESYFHAPSGQMHTIKFRLIRFEADHEDVYRYAPTREGYLVLMGMLDLEVEDYQVLIEKMLLHLIERGRFQQALELAGRARALSIEHRQQIRDFIIQNARAPGSVTWRKDINPRLSEARGHVEERQSVDHAMKESLTKKIRDSDSFDAKGALSGLHKLLEAANFQRMKLQVEISSAGDKFLEGQAAGFRPRRSSGLPDLEIKTLPEVMSKPVQLMAGIAESLLVSFYPAVAPKVQDLSNLFDVLLERRTRSEVQEEEDDDGEISEFPEVPPPFAPELIAKVHSWLDSKMLIGTPLYLDQVLKDAEEAGLSFMERKAVGYELYRAFADSESRYPHLHAQVAGEYESPVVSGDNLRFDPAAPNEEVSREDQ